MVQMILSDTAEPNATVRLRFFKRGSLAYIAHLDLVRTVTKVLVRAGIPVRYSEGFNPHPKIAFATAMSIGLESDVEFLDIRMAKTVDTEALRLAFNQSLTAEMQAVEAYIPETKFTDIAYSSYRITIVTAGADEALAARCEAALGARPLVVFKRSKSGDKDTDISASVKEASCRFENGAIVIDAVLTADNAGFLNPEYLITHLKEKCGILAGNPMKEHYTLLRTGLYRGDMTPFR
jgi:radical SAM-linked protein